MFEAKLQMIQRSVRYLAWAHARKLTRMLDNMFCYDCIWCFEHEKALLKKRFTSVFYTQCIRHGVGLGIADVALSLNLCPLDG